MHPMGWRGGLGRLGGIEGRLKHELDGLVLTSAIPPDRGLVVVSQWGMVTAHILDLLVNIFGSDAVSICLSNHCSSHTATISNNC